MADMEQHLLVLQPEAPDAEQLNAIFRAAHSIKGGGRNFWLQRFAGNHASDGKPAR
ncbi:Hpt domain-containing protein [Escherichia coli]|nr:Hpt domain-containing protein [Escherichia coli]